MNTIAILQQEKCYNGYLVYQMWNQDDIKRIKPPMYRIGRKHYNEYEVRQLMLDVAKGIAPKDIKVTCVKTRKISYINGNGLLTEPLPLFNLTGDISMNIIAMRVAKRRVNERQVRSMEKWH